MIEVLAPGLLTTVQDLGRFGFGELGVAPGGAADSLALRVANLLVGNAPGAAGLEITLMGPRLRFEQLARVAISGADLAPKINGHAVAMHRAIEVAAGSELAFGGGPAGVRSFVACAGGIAVPRVLGSASTHLRAGFGGLEGRALRSGNRLETGTHIGAPPSAPPPAILVERRSTLRILPGVHRELFTDRSCNRIVEEPFAVRGDSDRMGVRLEGSTLELAVPVELVSEGVAAGAVQVPPGGTPIVLGVDHPATGGYPQIAHVIAADLPSLAQLRPRQIARFAWTDSATALAALQAQETAIQVWGQVLK